MYNRDKLFIGGAWTAPESGTTLEVISPHSQQPIGTVALAGAADVDLAVRAARAAFDNGPWPRMQAGERIDAVSRLAGLYKENLGAMAELITAEIGAPISFAKRAQVGIPLMMFSAFGDLAAKYDWQETRPGLYGNDIRINKQPVGVVAAVVPWNMPQFLTICKVVPALLAGCTVVLKPSPESVLDAQFLADLVDQAGLPPGVFNVVPGDRGVGEALVRHPGVDKVSFTGSTAAGRQVAMACAEGLKQVSLELGGKSAAIVLDDADPARVAPAIQSASLANSGQVCNALSRILVPAKRHDEFVDALAAGMAAMSVGDPTDPEVQLGPLVAERQQARVRRYIEEGKREGARLVVGGAEMPDGLDTGWYVRPTLFADATNDMRIAREEIFGPVLTVIPYATEDDAVRIANDSDYGLAGSVFTSERERGFGIANRVRSGTFGVNQGYIMDPAAPFGGVKQSGYGRELGREGLESYLSSQSVSAAVK
ncbi:aldehyde dehydrogenase [Mycolicibacterium sp. 120270]|uniref:aldehyde dehydrogenase n=1 Tax=Mycolicibacterium sp. 120270 TaxID=3090600 RepID=UPI00299F0F1E|nr:aldehyde dehydrogenase [Mycolicibacterium sp. 120270]MDX1885730.1 aldehyde dehydrogenase [Mycolicibacterium sp. 120270]